MRIVADLAIAARISKEVLPPGVALARMGKALPEWCPALFMAELEPFERLVRHGEINAKFPVTAGSRTPTSTVAGAPAGRDGDRLPHALLEPRAHRTGGWRIMVGLPG